MSKATGYAASHSFTRLKPIAFERDEPKANEVEIEILFCGVCHSDIHQVKNEWHNTVYPCMPGHEIVGRVARTGGGVTRHQVGDLVGVGCMVDSCRQCEPCQTGDQNYCEGPNSWLATYNGPMMPAEMADTGTNMYNRDNTYGGYSSSIVVAEDFVLKMHRRSVAGSVIGNLAETQEVLDFCAEHGIGPDIQVIPIQEINDAYKKVIDGEVRFRYVIDMATLKLDEAS